MEFLTHGTLNTLAGYGLSALTGAAGGYLVYRFVGCRTGACPLTSKPWTSILYGAIVGLSMGPLT